MDNIILAMHRRQLLQQLIQYHPQSKAEQRIINRLSCFVSQHDRCFDRELEVGHITGSAWLVNHVGDKVLLTHHRKLNIWCQLGGHCDGQSNTVEVARQEAVEESGIRHIKLFSDQIFDVDIHLIPERPGEPEHSHYDIRYIFQLTEPADFVISDESNELRWVSYQESMALELDASVRRMFQKWRE